jgi:predicted ATP-grasp superfamily ATP-dependent carboligase
MRPSVLLVSTATHWFAQARMPRCLFLAGFEVALLAPQGSLGEKSRYVAKHGHLPANATAAQWIDAFAAIVDASAPALVLPCDDTAFRLMQALVLSPPAHLDPALHRRLSTLLEASLGDPEFYDMSVDKTLLPPAAEALGVRIPAYIVVEERREADAFAAAQGFPIVVKRAHSTAGDGVAICATQGELSVAFTELTRPDLRGLSVENNRRLLVQAHVPGRIQYYAVAAWKGALVAGTAVEKVDGVPKGPSTVSRYFREDTLRDFSARLVRGFCMTGIIAPEFVIHERTGDAYLLELNRRMTHGTHTGAAMNVDAGAALFAALTGTPSTTRDDFDIGEEHVCVHFPGEWMRNPESRWLREHPVDAPWDEPELFEAMLALRRVL